MALFLLFIIVAIALGIVGAVVKGLFWLLIIGVVVIIVDLVLLGVRVRAPEEPCDALTGAWAQPRRAASGAVRGPSPRLVACRRSAAVSTSERRLGTSASRISTAPPARYRRADPAPNRGRNGVPGRAAYSVVPVPAASATNASGQRAAARSPRSSSAGRSAGRSAASPAVPDLGQRAAASDAPWASAGFSPAARLVRHDHRAQLTQRARGGRVVRHHDHGRHHRAGGRRAHRVRRHGQGQLLPDWSSQAGQAGFGAGKYLDGDHQRPAERALGHTGDHTVPAAGRADRWLRRVMAMPRHGDGRNGRLAAMRNLLSSGGRAHR